MNTTIDTVIERWATAERTGDTAGLDSLLAEDFVGIGAVGFVLDRDAWLTRFTNGLRRSAIRLPILRAYLAMPSERFVRRDFAVTAAAPDAAILDDAARRPVFALTPVS